MAKLYSQDEVLEAFGETFEIVPSLETWGFFCYDDAPGGIGGGLGYFSWFDSQKEMIEFIYRFPLFVHSCSDYEDESEDPDLAATFAELRKILEKSLSQGTLDAETVKQLNEKLRGCDQVSWWGQLKDLTEGESDFAIDIREQFREEGSAPIGEEEIDEFLQFLYDWGH